MSEAYFGGHVAPALQRHNEMISRIFEFLAMQPILHRKHAFLTGEGYQYNRGDLATIVSVLQSYSSLQWGSQFVTDGWFGSTRGTLTGISMVSAYFPFFWSSLFVLCDICYVSIAGIQVGVLCSKSGSWVTAEERVLPDGSFARHLAVARREKPLVAVHPPPVKRSWGPCGVYIFSWCMTLIGALAFICIFPVCGVIPD